MFLSLPGDAVPVQQTVMFTLERYKLFKTLCAYRPLQTKDILNLVMAFSTDGSAGEIAKYVMQCACVNSLYVQYGGRSRVRSMVTQAPRLKSNSSLSRPNCCDWGYGRKLERNLLGNIIGACTTRIFWCLLFVGETWGIISGRCLIWNEMVFLMVNQLNSFIKHNYMFRPETKYKWKLYS